MPFEEGYKCFRVTMDDDEAIQEICRGTSALVCKEGDDENVKVHYHCLVWTRLSVGALRIRVYKALGAQENISRLCAFTNTKSYNDVEPYKRYVCKGKDASTPAHVVVNTLEENVEELHEEYWREFSRLKEKKKKDKEETKSRAKEFYDYFAAVVRGEISDEMYRTINPRDEPSPDTLTIEICGLYVVRFFHENGYPMPSKYHAQQMAVTAYSRHQTPSARKEQALLEYYGFVQCGWL